MIISGILTLIFLVIFLASYLTDSRRIINGFLFNVFFCSFIIFLCYLGFSSDLIIVRLFAIVPIVILVFILTFGLSTICVGLFLNARILLKRESRRFANSLTLISGIFLLLFILFRLVNPMRFLPYYFEPLYTGVSFIIVYFFLHLTNFLSAYLLYQFNRPKLNQDFIIVLGSGLIKDKVPPLLASRINKAIDFYWKQVAIASPPILIFSGGQGPDEDLPEAEAMQNYAIEKGIPLEHTLTEARSINTFQNMLYSKQIMDSVKGSKYNSIFTTNNFHLFRASLYAKKAGLKSQGIGSKTALYYWPNAMIREYIAIVVMQRKRHTIIVGTILGFSVLLTIFSFLFL
ncbi:YdcF family protein [Lysinibacillus boronitolerans]|uniref:Membrane protein n=1 Tax=Lysinibacillus boronitolerans JCM 21713 = 10a = NBRC 103108 TaxID=1294264 RepID=A0ABR4XWT5_9BACI|nr:membrane protein [Lysinibacillus boronitolerans JCM 21713 = 10a = NBRC 103108]